MAKTNQTSDSSSSSSGSVSEIAREENFEVDALAVESVGAAPVVATDVVTETSVNVDVFNAVVLRAATARPTTRLDVMVIVALEMVVQFMPSAERCAVNVFPLRISLSQTGAVTPVVAGGPLVVPLVALRPWMTMPLLGVMLMVTCLEPAARVSRNITPALAPACVFCTPATRAMIVPLPVQGM